MKTILISLCVLAGLVSSSLGDVLPIGAKKAVVTLGKDPKVVVVDLRTPKEFAKGHIKGAINLDMRDKDFSEKLGKFDRKKTYLMHCRSGGRSSASIPVWDSLGFENVLHLTTGTLGWVKAGQKLFVPAEKAAK